jgi:hypothetical protein
MPRILNVLFMRKPMLGEMRPRKRIKVVEMSSHPSTEFPKRQKSVSRHSIAGTVNTYHNRAKLLKSSNKLHLDTLIATCHLEGIE